jgi:hypothetical protein
MMNSPSFAEAYNCPIGSPMNPTRKCSIWWENIVSPFYLRVREGKCSSSTSVRQYCNDQIAINQFLQWYFVKV